MIVKLKKKIELSKTLEEIEVNKDSKNTISMLDNFHSKPKAHVLGITGPPGVGKSSLIDRLIRYLRNRKFSVGVIAVDPSSSQSGGALLGDRTRFVLDPNDDDVYVRSMATKNYLGGISELTYPTMVVMRSMFDYLIIETVGVGQSETNIKNMVDTVVLCVQPGSGDTIQFMKSGVFEIPDIIIVTKSDIEKLSNLTFSDLSGSKEYFKSNDNRDIKIILTSSHKNLGFDNLFDELMKRWVWLKKEKKLKNLRFKQDQEWIKKTIISDYGTSGFIKLKKKINYKSEPFKTLYTLKKKIGN
jgi:LAO/AO transport system kinase